MSNIGVPELVVIIVVVVVCALMFTIVPYWFIFRKAGYHPALSLLMIVPLVSLAMLLFLAFSDWPALKNIHAAPDSQG